MITIFLCLNQTITFSAPNKKNILKIFHKYVRTLGFRGGVFFVIKFDFTDIWKSRLVCT